MPVGCSSGQPTGFFVGGAGDKVLRVLKVLNDLNDLKGPNDPNDLKIFNALDAIKIAVFAPPLREKFSPTLKSG